MSKKKVNEIEIPLVFHNYKLLENKEFTIGGSYIYFVQGPNDVGKTSFLNALESLMTAKDDTPLKVTRNIDNEEKGFYEATLPAADGSNIIIRNDFSNDRNRFIAIREDGTKVDKVTEIRKLFNYTPIKVDEFFALGRSAEGRRKQRDIILKLLPESAREQFNDLDLQEQHWFDKRAETNKSLKQAEANVITSEITDNDKLLIDAEQEAKELLMKYEYAQAAKDKMTDWKQQDEEYDVTIEDLKRRLAETKAKKEAHQEKKPEEVEPEIAKKTNEEIQASITSGKSMIEKIDLAKAKKILNKESIEKRDKLQLEHDEQDEKVKAFREKKAAIVAEADLPVKNISFEDGYLTIDGLRFDESQVCESDGVLLLANILAKINPGPVQVIGDASILDAKKLEQLHQIAEANNKIMFVDEVVRFSEEMVVVGYEGTTKELPSNPPESKGRAAATEKSSEATEDPGTGGTSEQNQIDPENNSSDNSDNDTEGTQKPDLLF
jgi:energy-coupling factor transporter ATP-binding protein EcfA2